MGAAELLSKKPKLTFKKKYNTEKNLLPALLRIGSLLPRPPSSNRLKIWDGSYDYIRRYLEDSPDP